MATNQEKFDDLHREGVTQKSPSRSFLADGGNPIDTPLGVAWNTDGNGWNVVMTFAYFFDVPFAVQVFEYVAKNGPYTGTFAAANPWLANFGQTYCKGAVKFKSRLNQLFDAHQV